LSAKINNFPSTQNLSDNDMPAWEQYKYISILQNTSSPAECIYSPNKHFHTLTHKNVVQKKERRIFVKTKKQPYAK